MDFFTVVKDRYSYREPFCDVPVPQSDLETIIAAGLAAPSGKNEQTTTFVVVTDPEKVGMINTMHTQKAMNTARAFIACIIDRQPEAVYEGHAFHIEDCAAAVENMLLAITALGYASVWIDGWLRVDGRADLLGAIIQLPQDKVVRVLLPVGVPAVEGPRREKKSFGERAWFNTWKKA